MNKRNFVRYGAELLPGSLSRVTISWEGHASIGSYVVDYSPQGMGLIIPATLNSLDIPKGAESVKVLMPVGRTWLNGQCVYARTEPDGSVSLGLHFSDPQERDYLKNLLFTSLKVPAESRSFVSYEWEELVGRLCDSEDPTLHKIGRHHLALIRERRDRPQT